jgi:hypothetical protein
MMEGELGEMGREVVQDCFIALPNCRKLKERLGKRIIKRDLIHVGESKVGQIGGKVEWVWVGGLTIRQSEMGERGGKGGEFKVECTTYPKVGEKWGE